MSFLYPSFLWALAALAIPVAIHLFNFRKTTRVFFSNTRFLREVKEATTAKRRLKHYLILASRLLFVFFLVITFCQPVIPAREQLAANPNIVLYLDNSQSMSAQMDDKTRGLDAAVMFARNIVDVFPPDTRYKLITNDFSPFSNTYKTRPELLDLLTQVRLSPVSRTMAEIHERIRQEGTTRNREVFWISDLQKSTLGPITQGLDSGLRFHLVPIQYGQLANIFVDSAYLENPFSAGGGKNVLHVKVRNDGDRDVDQLNLKLSINNVQAGASVVNIAQGGVNETTFDLTAGLTGLNEAKITFNDFPVAFDNEFYVALNFTEKIRVLEIKPAAGATVVEKVFGNKDVFTFTSFPVSNFNYNLLNQADLVVVNGLNSIDASLAGALRHYISGYGAALLIPGTTPDAASLNAFMQLPSLKTDDSKQPQAELDRPDFSNPFFQNVFEEKTVSLAMPKATRALDWGGDNSALLKFKNDQPFLSQFSQVGKLYVLSCALDATQTDFFNHAVFVPVMYRMAASGKKNDIKPYYTLLEDYIALHVDTLRGEEPLKWVGAEEVVPAQRRVNDDVIFDIPKFSIIKGFYKVVMQRDTINLLAFNLDKAESLMDQYSGAEMKAALGGGDAITIFEVATADTFSNEIKERYLGTPLWKYALALALLFLVTEILLIRFLK